MRSLTVRLIDIIILSPNIDPFLYQLLPDIHTTEKRIPYKVIKVAMRCYGDKPRSFMQINPSGGIPVAIVKVESRVENHIVMSIISSLSAISIPSSLLPFLPLFFLTSSQPCNWSCCLPSFLFPSVLPCFLPPIFTYMLSTLLPSLPPSSRHRQLSPLLVTSPLPLPTW